MMDKGDVMAFTPVIIVGMKIIYGAEAAPEVLRQTEAKKSGVS